ncbi:hypothetical protein Tco_0644525 [Tanacetum coccineum]
MSITKSDYKNLNKNDIEDMYMLIINHKVDDYTKTGLLWSLSVFNRSTVIWERVHDFQLVYGIIYKNNKKEKREMRHQKVHKFCDATLKRVFEGLKSYNNDVKYGYVTHNLSKEDVEYLQLFAEEIEERLNKKDDWETEIGLDEEPLKPHEERHSRAAGRVERFSIRTAALLISQDLYQDSCRRGEGPKAALRLILGESGWCYTDDMKYTRTYRHTQCWHKEQRWRDELRLQICFWIEQTRRETRGVVENTGGDDFGGIFVLLAGDVTLGEVGGCWDWEVELGVIQAAGTTRIKGERCVEELDYQGAHVSLIRVGRFLGRDVKIRIDISLKDNTEYTVTYRNHQSGSTLRRSNKSITKASILRAFSCFFLLAASEVFGADVECKDQLLRGPPLVIISHMTDEVGGIGSASDIFLEFEKISND